MGAFLWGDLDQDQLSKISRGSWCIKGTDESVTRVNLSVPVIHHDLSDLGSLILIQITQKERTLSRLTTIPVHDSTQRSTNDCVTVTQLTQSSL